MFITHETKVIFTDNIVDDIICNMCGNSIYKSNDTGYFDDCLNVEKEWSYESDYDNETHEFHLCQDCYKKIDFSIQNTSRNRRN